MSEIFEHSTLIEHLFAGRQPKQARIEKKTTLEQYLSANQDTMESQEEAEENQSSIKFLPDTTDILGDQDAFYLIQKLFSFLKCSNVNETQIGYFGKALNLISKNYCIEFWNFSKICGSIISDIISHLKFKQIQEFFAKVIIMDHPSRKNFSHHFKQRKDLVQGLFECLLEWEDSLNFLESVSEFLNCIFQFGGHLYEHINEMLDLIIKPAFYYEIAYKSKESAVYKLYYHSICFLGILNTQLLTQQNVQQYLQIDNVLKQITQLNTQIPSFQLAIQSNLANLELFQNHQYENYKYLFGNNNLIVVKSIDVIIRFHNQELIDLLFQHKVLDYLLVSTCSIILQHLTSLFHLNNQLHFAVFSIFNYLIIQDVHRILTQTQLLEFLNVKLTQSKNNSQQGSMGSLKKIGYLLLPSLANDELNQPLKTRLLEFKQQEESFLLNVDPKDCKEIPPVSLSIDRQIEMMLDEKNNNNNQNSNQHPN
ncbi:unnamed protein product (macronuclear) [Paramecium tetraurelia]|uniref:Uncharacterized protein n=1 Tax=Paramecium tetraurelia TaxID=5888 RepID=A0BNW1_PARTE|nr:uncharacterized protein GSPATT00030867001 [Paramecium tetraurelia]CAK60228.1 unnamed protein product [Paramecium tetraurelia]|eukprot:XP_001427626.1 hypothetical protein (macronuclear) [Paramecium tetraurelia strain d4-2]